LVLHQLARRAPDELVLHQLARRVPGKLLLHQLAAALPLQSIKSRTNPGYCCKSNFLSRQETWEALVTRVKGPEQ
jgi:hypothetical protein